MKPHQLERANSYVREELSLLIGSSVADPRVHALIVTDVDLSADRRTARVYVGCYDETVDLKEGLRGLENAKEFIRRELGAVLGWRYTPELVFRADKSLQRGARLDKVFKQMEQERATQNAEQTTEETMDKDVSTGAD